MSDYLTDLNSLKLPSNQEIEEIEEIEEIDDPIESPEEVLAAWKMNLREDFDTWLESITELPAEILDNDAISEKEPDEGPDPDIYAFYAELAASNAENRKTNRRAAEAFSQWGDVVSGLAGNIQDIQRQIGALPKPETGVSRNKLLSLIDLSDRLERLQAAFASPPPPVKKGWFGESSEAWEKAWSSQSDAARILLGHFASMLHQFGLEKRSTVGQVFDPRTMSALANEVRAGVPANTVLEEIAPGWNHEGTLLRPAQVKVSQ